MIQRLYLHAVFYILVSDSGAWYLLKHLHMHFIKKCNHLINIATYDVWQQRRSYLLAYKYFLFSNNVLCLLGRLTTKLSFENKILRSNDALLIKNWFNLQYASLKIRIKQCGQKHKNV